MIATNWGAGQSYVLAPEYNPYNGSYNAANAYLNSFNGFMPTSAQAQNQGYYNSLLYGNGTAGSGSETLNNYASAAGSIAGSYNNATTSSGGSTLSGAASGAIAGYEVGGGWGALVGGIIGGLSGLFGSKSKKKDDKKAYEREYALRIAQLKEEEAQYQRKQAATSAALSNYSQFSNQSPYTGGILGATGSPNVLGQRPQAAPQQAPPANFAQAPTMPTYTSDPTGQQANLQTGALQYQAFLQQQQQQQAANALNAYGQYGLIGG